MKVIYSFMLVSLITCLTTKEKIQCFTENENLLEQVAKVIDAFKTKDFQNIFSTILSAYFSVKDDIKDCLNGEPNLKETYCHFRCRPYNKNDDCIKKCTEFTNKHPGKPFYYPPLPRIAPPKRILNYTKY